MIRCIESYMWSTEECWYLIGEFWFLFVLSCVIQVSLLSCLRARMLLQDIPTDAGFLCDNASPTAAIWKTLKGIIIRKFVMLIGGRSRFQCRVW